MKVFSADMAIFYPIVDCMAFLCEGRSKVGQISSSKNILDAHISGVTYYRHTTNEAEDAGRPYDPFRRLHKATCEFV